MALLGRVAGKCCRSLLSEPSKGLFFSVLQPGWIQSCVGAKRHLLSEDVVKLQDFQQRKLAVAHLVTGSEGNYIDLFKQKMQRNELILRDELKLLLHLCQTPEEMLIARDAIYRCHVVTETSQEKPSAHQAPEISDSLISTQRYHAENRNLLYGDFKFGPVFMRLCYEMGLEELAAATITDNDMKGFFIDTTSFNIAIDMLFIKGSYESAMEVLRTMRDQGVPFNKDTVTLATAFCYKLNTTESYRICTALIEEEQTKGHFIPRHAYCFAVALALRRNDLEKAQSLFSQIMSFKGKICLNLKVIILTMSGEVEEAVLFLSAAMLPKGPFFVKKTEFSQEVVDLLRLRSDGRPIKVKVEEVVTQLERAGQVTQQTLDEMLCHAPTGKRNPALLEGVRRNSRRTLRPLQSTLLSE